jgi:hypothetical protein
MGYPRPKEEWEGLPQDESGLFIVGDGSYYDRNGYYFDHDGYDEFGGYYDDFMKYKPGSAYEEEYFSYYKYIIEDDVEDDYDVKYDVKRAVSEEHILPAVIYLKQEHAKDSSVKFTVKIEGISIVVKKEALEEKLKKELPNKAEFKLVFMKHKSLKEHIGFFVSSDLGDLVKVLNLHNRVIICALTKVENIWRYRQDLLDAIYICISRRR